MSLGVPGRRLRLILSALLVSAIAVTVSTIVVMSDSNANTAHGSWAPSESQLTATEHTLMVVTTADNPALAPADAAAAAKVATTWPANVSKVEYIATDRASAAIAMGTPGAVSGDSSSVLLFQLTGPFAARNLPSPRGAKVSTYGYAQFIVDPTTASVIDFGFVDNPMAWNSAPVQVIMAREAG